MAIEVFLRGLRGGQVALPLPPRKRRTQPIDQAVLHNFRGRKTVILSPHFDDACFSLGNFLLRLGQGDLVNIFTQGTCLARWREPEPPEPTQVHAIRDAEDTAFAACCGLRRHDLNCEEPSLRRRRPSQQAYLEDDIYQIAQPVLVILEKIARHIPSGSRGVLFAPLGIGRHVNHRATAALVMRLQHIIEPHYDIYLYEDLPYARNTLHRLAALARARATIGAGRRFMLQVDWKIKQKLIEFYPSQLKATVRGGKFRPGTFGMQESFWSVPSSFSAAEA
jgi:LmbE family N-acetylglucosaminyl deacetylase